MRSSRVGRSRLGSAIGILAILVIVGLVGGTAAASEREMSDQGIADAVEDEMFFDLAVPAYSVDIEVNEGIVELEGDVDNLLAKNRATKIAETVRGVRSVINRIDVVTRAARTDDEIAGDIEAALLRDRATEAYEVDASVDGNRVILEGTVDSWQEKDLVAKVVAGVRGVRSIENRLEVNYDADRTDTEIAGEAAARLRWDALVDGELIDVSVAEAAVTLTGTVGSAAEKRRAKSLVWVAGVRSVDASDLAVKDWAAEDHERRSTYVPKGDAAIRKAVNDAMFYDPRVLSTRVIVDVDNGAVDLRGTVNNLKAKSAAENVAKHTIGVIDVDNRIKVRGPRPSDAELRADVTASFRADPFIEPATIDVRVMGGTAYLTGTVDDYFEKGRAEDLVSRIDGVRHIYNGLDVERTRVPLTYDPYLWDVDPLGLDWYDYAPWNTFRTDAEIHEEIVDEMWWSPFVDSDQIEIRVVDGVAYLSGTVDSRSERDAAIENAYEGGAVWVRDRMTIGQEDDASEETPSSS